MAEPTDYDNADFIPGGHGYFARWEAAAGAFRARHPDARLGLVYGDHPRERFDLFLPGRDATAGAVPAGLVVFLHGGFWRMGDRALWSHLAAGALARGHAVALPSYPLCPEARIAGITRSIARALPAMAAEVAGPIHLAGHSAGGHLALRMACPDAGLPAGLAARLAAILALSPLADLAPLMDMPMNADLRIDPGEARAESPVHHPAPGLPVFAEVGAEERPAFLDQALRLADAWPDTHLTIAAGRHHFDVIDPLTDPASPMLDRFLGR
jgi:acetyl esterase/lipase